MLKELQDFGLSEKEARVYLASIEIGRATADQLAKHAKIVRPTTYVQIKSLMEKGLMSTYEEGKKTYFAPESPEALKRVLEKQKENLRTNESLLQTLLPALLLQFEGAGERPVVRFFPGKEGVSATREEALMTKSKKIYTIFSYEHLANLFSEKELDEYSERRRGKGVYSKGIQLHKPHFERVEFDALTERRFIAPDVLALSIDLSIFDNKTVIRSYSNEPFGVIIESEEIAENMRSIFDFLWLNSEEPKKKEA